MQHHEEVRVYQVYGPIRLHTSHLTLGLRTALICLTAPKGVSMCNLTLDISVVLGMVHVLGALS
jgi:hypothetical protein